MEDTKKQTLNETYQEIISIPLMAILLPFIIIICLVIFSLNKYVIGTSSNDNILTDEKVSLTDNNNTENIITTILEEDNNLVKNNTNDETQEKQENQVDTNVATYTASNGKNYDVIGTLNIPSLDINYPILSTTSTELLKVSLNKYWGANPNEVGNMVVIGHNYKNNKFFSKLPSIEKGAIVEVTDLKGTMLKYTVYDTIVVDPYDNSCTSQLTNGKTEITLITCYYQNGSTHADKRFVVKARVN